MSIWLTAAKLEEAQGNVETVDKIIPRAIAKLQEAQVVISRWVGGCLGSWGPFGVCAFEWVQTSVFVLDGLSVQNRPIQKRHQFCFRGHLQQQNAQTQFWDRFRQISGQGRRCTAFSGIRGRLTVRNWLDIDFSEIENTNTGSNTGLMTT